LTAEPSSDAAPKGRTWNNPFRVHRHGGKVPYLWLGMGTGTWLRFMAAGNFDITLNCLPRILGVTLISPLNTAVSVASQALYGRRIARTEVVPPLFILGHWRTGTTLLHELFGADPRHAYPTNFECVFPRTFLLTEGLGRIAGGWLVPGKRPFDDMPLGLDHPQEDDVAFANLGMGTPYRTFAYPRHGIAGLDYAELDDLSPEERAAWEAEFLAFVRRLQFGHAGKRLVLKSPIHTARIPTLLRLFPDARFVHIARNPYDVFPSTVHAWKALASTQGLHNPVPEGDKWTEDVLQVFMRLFEGYERGRGLIPPGHLAEISYEDLVAGPKSTIAGLYRDLGLGDFAPAEPAIAAYLQREKGHRRNRFILTAEERRRIGERWAPYFRRFGYAIEP
jgi:hypothetical protein